MMFRTSDRLYVDESKARGYYVVATAAAVGSVRECERSLRTLLKPGQRRVHFKSERDSRRREILSRMNELDVRVAVWISDGRPNKEARDLCMVEMAAEACRSGVDELIIERDASLEVADRRLIAGVVQSEAASHLRYQHSAPHEHPLLWVSDAVAWCCSSGGDWKRRAEPLVKDRVVRL
ncbi:hypothetical protein [Microbacterium sp.]|uniref:hypothetical protein n=1 Tax=Microbacterium sp. TaxID=51671 RepID=UPI0039E3D398